MKPKTFRKARKALGLSQRQLAKVIGISWITVKKYEMPTDATNHRDVSPPIEALMKAYLSGYRPPKWPAKVTTSAEG